MGKWKRWDGYGDLLSPLWAGLERGVGGAGEWASRPGPRSRAGPCHSRSAGGGASKARVPAGREGRTSSLRGGFGPRHPCYRAPLPEAGAAAAWTARGAQGSCGGGGRRWRW